MRFRMLLLIPLASALLYACEHDAELPAGYTDVLLQGTVTDEALVAFAGALDQGPPDVVPSRAPTLDSPAEGAVIPKASATTFNWHFGMTASAPKGANPGFSEKAAWWNPLSPPVQAARPIRLLQKPLRELFGPVRSAYAHGDPFTGVATFLVFSTDSDPRLLRVFTSETSYAPDTTAWGKLAAAGKPITLTLSAADFESNRIVQEGGPFAGSSITFTISP
ncbi:MAG: hypothetical protein HUU21_00245 [Polyangiaceae bacterium]|nr:hypothetical protein [Polyangiaceae bacterium]NUQ71994.1 hypothetical protein [Polyangiaceae bacterium]